MKADDSLNITVCGESFSLSSQNDEEYVKKLAEYVDGRLNEIIAARGGSLMPQTLRTALLALNLADDLFKEQRKNLEFTQTTLAYPALDSQIIIDLKSKIHGLEKQLSLKDEQARLLQNDLNKVTKLYKEKKKELEDNINVNEKKN